tara:strand:+ start:6699 stop:9671 length:2973 start_codon:yes stop_codon:yes gene_type:complete
MAENDVINLDPLILQRLSQSSANAASTSALPVVAPTPTVTDQLPATGIRPAMVGAELPSGSSFLGPEDDLRDTMLEDKPSTADLALQAGILNEGIPTSLRAALSTTTLFDPELQKKNVQHNLKRYFKNEGLINDDYDFGLRVGDVSKKLEFKDPRFNGKYNVLDPFATVQNYMDIPGDLADISADTLLPIATETTAGVLAAFTPGVGFSGAPSIVASTVAAGVTSMSRLKFAQLQGFLPEDITDEQILDQAFQEAKLSGLFGFGGAVAFKLFKPVLRAVGLARPKFDFDIDEATFIKAFDKYMASPAGKMAAEKGITPSSAQVLEAAAKDATNIGDAAAMQASATELAEREALVATSPSRETAEGILTPSRTAALTAEKAVKEASQETPMPVGVEGQANRMGEVERLRLGENIQAEAATRLEAQTLQTKALTDDALFNIDKAIDDAVNLPSSVADAASIGNAARDAIGESYGKASAAIGKNYEDLFKRWSDSTGISIDSVKIGKGGIKPSEAARLASDIRKTFADRPFLNDAERKVVNKVYDNFVTSEKGGAISVKDVSLRTINENIRDLRRLERQAYRKTLTGEDAPYPETLSKMVDALEKARNRVLSRKDAPAGMADELKVLDDQFADFSRKFRNTTLSAVAKLRNAKNPEAAWNLLFQRDRTGKTAVLDIAAELKTPDNASLYYDIGATIRKKWQDTVVKKDARGQIKEINVAAHNKFINEYGAVMDTYLSRAERAALGSATEFSEQVVQVQARQKGTLEKISRQFDLGGGKAVEPETIFENSWKADRFAKFDQVHLLLRESPELLDTYKAFVYKDIWNPAAGRTKTVNGREVMDPVAMRNYLDSNKDKLSTLFGQDYTKNLRTVVDATEAALTDVPTRGARKEGNMLTGLIRGYVGMFTRPGRFLTAFNKVRGNVKEDALTTALADPRAMAEAAKASMKSPLSSELEKTIGRVLFGRYDYPIDGELPVDKPNEARAILQELEAGNR